MSFTVAIVGRPNVGKSTLFNRLVGARPALVHDTPGVTRDRREGEGRIGPLRFRAIDTAGLEEADGESLAGRMMAQTEKAVAAAEVALFMIDGRAGVTPVDRHFARWLRRRQVPVILAVNKCEGRAGEAGVLEAYQLGFGDPLPISAEHGDGLSDLYDALAPYAESTGAERVEDEEAEPEEAPLKLAIVGRPNVGKSTLINKLLGEERFITGPEAGLTRDAVPVEWIHEGRRLQLVDTAGIRRQARVAKRLDKLSVAHALKAIRRAHVVVLVVDADEPLHKQDLAIADLTVEEGRAPVIALNKWDLVKEPAAVLKETHARLGEALPQAKGVPVVALSALTGRGVARLLPAVFKAYELWNRRVATGPLNHWLARAVEGHSPPLAQGRRIKLRYITQIKARPPTFALFVSKPADLPASYRRYLVNGLRDEFGFPGVPVRLLMRKGKNPYAPS